MEGKKRRRMELPLRWALSSWRKTEAERRVKGEIYEGGLSSRRGKPPGRKSDSARFSIDWKKEAGAKSGPQKMGWLKKKTLKKVM